MERTNFEKLEVYRLWEKPADKIWKIAMGWENFAKATIGYQIVRAADSIGANIAEGMGRGTPQDHRRFIRTARGSLNETKRWLRRAFGRNLLARSSVNELKPILDELSPKLNAYLRSIPSNSSGLRAGAAYNRQPTTHNPQSTTNTMQPCIFCKIIAREAPARIVYEDETVVAFEDAHPQAPAHLLVVPRVHLPSLQEACPEDESMLGHLLVVAARLARERKIEKGYRTVVNNGSLAGQSVFHLHVHVLGGRVFHWPPG